MAKKYFLVIGLIIVAAASAFAYRNFAKKKVCPDEWYVNAMPGPVETANASEKKEYLIIDGKRQEISNYDMEWIKTNCSVNQPSYLY